ncbi:DUF3558 domain-containing protein [Streptomyces sp. BV286]|uniref:DUF3558 domain-containing protein n=1 Tax=Streptomyces sp. BV286 TaxID=2849672 RepID=UPI001C2EA3E7|nr:DUF3558 domain-containing protein [Streptomyces sp. BV286]MBV1938446.1 DUF3558 domain-containing protein [Streptomyces sp. BV286]
MQRKAYVSGVAALLAVLLAGCTGGSSDDGGEDDPKPGDTATTAAAPQPGKYRTLPEPCGAVSQSTLDSLLPGIKQVTDEEQREKAYEGTATPTYDTDRKVGCRWKAESATATDHLLVDFERVVSYDNAVSDDERTTAIYLEKETAADLPEPVASSSDSPDASPSGSSSEEPGSGSSPGSGGSGTPDDASTGSSSSASPSGNAASGSTPTALQPRTLDDLGNEAFLDDSLNTSQQRTVTVVFRTSNVVVTIQYDEQPATTTDVPSSEEMQDRAQKLAGQLAETFNE